MAVCVFTHFPIFRIFFKDRCQVRHICVYVLFQRNDDTLICIFQQIAVTKIRAENKICQRIRVCHGKGNLVRPLIALDRSPVNMNISLFFQTLENRTVIGFRFCIGRITCHTCQCRRLSKRKFQLRRIYLLEFSGIKLYFTSAACCQ